MRALRNTLFGLIAWLAAAQVQGAALIATKAQLDAPSSASQSALLSLKSIKLKSGSVLVLDEATQKVLLAQQADVAVPIASITKLMTALVILDAKLPMDEVIEIAADDANLERTNVSRLRVGTRLTRADLLHLALMSSENRAAHALGRSYPGGVPAVVRAMNVKAGALGMTRSVFVDPTGLNSGNIASPEDLSKLVLAASKNSIISAYSTDSRYSVRVGKHLLEYRNTNTLVANSSWDIAVQKTGYIEEAGKCLVMKAMIAGRSVVIVLLDSYGKYTRVADAKRIKQWMEAQRRSSKA